MPQMDFSTFLTQVFWLILLISFSFIYLMQSFFSQVILLLKIKSKSFLNNFKFFFKFLTKVQKLFYYSFKTIISKFLNILSRNNFTSKWNYLIISLTSLLFKFVTNYGVSLQNVTYNSKLLLKNYSFLLK